MAIGLAHFSQAERTAIMTLVYQGSGADHTAVADETALALITDMTDKMLCFVEATGQYRYDSTSTETAAVGNVVTPSSGVGRWIRISGISDLRIHTPVADETTLAAIAAGERSDKMLCFVEGTGLFWFDATGATTAAAGDVVAPAAGTGRWYRITGLNDLKLHLFVADETALAAIPASSRADGMLVLVDANGIYRFDAASAATAAAGNVVAPAAGTGRWFRITALADMLLHAPVADEAALAAIVDGELADRELCYVDANGLYQYDAGSVAGAVTGEIVVPAGGTGRWIRISQASDLISRRFLRTIAPAQYWVGFAGANDANAGTMADPLATIQAAIDAANAAALTEVDIFVKAKTASYAEALDFDSTTLTRICLHAVGGVVTTTTHECDANSVLARLDFVGNWVFSGASSLDIAVAADPFLATGFYARDTVWSTSLAITGVTIADLKGSYAAQFSNFECGLVNCPSVGTVWRNEWDQQGDHPLGVTGAAVTLEEGGSGVPPVITHVDTGAAAGSVQVTLRGGVIVGTGAAGRDCVMTAQVANGAILTVEEGARIVGSTDNAGNDNNVGALCVVELLPGGSISNLEGWTVGGTVNDRRSFVSTEQTGTGAPQNVAHGLGRIPEKVLVAFTELPAPAVFQSTEQTGTGAEQNVAHGLGSAPSFVSWGLSEFDGAAGDLVPGAHDGTNLKFTASSAAVKFYCQAILFPAAPDVAEGAHDATNVVLTVTAGAKFKVYAS